MTESLLQQLKARLRMGDPLETAFVIHAMYVDPRGMRPHGRAIERKTKWYPTDLTEEEWARFEPAAEAGEAWAQVGGGFARGTELDSLNPLGNGCRMQPRDFPPLQKVY